PGMIPAKGCQSVPLVLRSHSAGARAGRRPRRRFQCVLRTTYYFSAMTSQKDLRIILGDRNREEVCKLFASCHTAFGACGGSAVIASSPGELRSSVAAGSGMMTYCRQEGHGRVRPALVAAIFSVAPHTGHSKRIT